MLQTKINKNLLIAGLIFLLVFAVFAFTLAPGLYTEDSADFITASATLGIPHPSGYPTYTMLGFLFSKIPLGEIPWRINLMSAFFGALTISLLYLIIKKIGQKFTKGFPLEIVSILATLSFAFSQTFWRESIVAEIYSLNTFFVALTLLLAVNFYQTRKTRHLYLLSFFFGLGLTNHYSLLTLAPAFLLLLPPDSIRRFKKIKSWMPAFAGMAFCFLLGLLPYLYLPLRARTNPPLNWLNPSSSHNLQQVLQFNLPTNHHLTANLFKFIPELLNNYQLEFIPSTMGTAGMIGLLVLAMAGISLLIKKDRRLGLFLFFAFLLTSLGPIVVLTHGAPPNFSINWFLNVMFIPHYLILTIFIAAGFFGLGQLLKPLLFYPCLAAFGVLIFWLFCAHFQINNLSQEFLVDDYSRLILKNLPNNSILIIKEDDLNQDTISLSLAYLTMVEKQRLDVLIASDTQVFKLPSNLKLPENYLAFNFQQQKEALAQTIWEKTAQPQQRPLFITSPTFFVSLREISQREIEKDMGAPLLISWPTHCLYQIAPQNQKPNLQSCSLSLEENTLGLKNDWGLKLLASKIQYDQAAFWQAQGQKQKASALLQKAIEIDPFPLSARYQEFIEWRQTIAP